MATKDVPDKLVCKVVAERDAVPIGELRGVGCPLDILADMTGQPRKVCLRAMERSFRHGYLEYGISIRTAWLTEAGWQFLEESEAAP